MPRYEYRSYDKEEKEHNGVIDGASEDDALQKLSDLNLTPISLDELNFDGTKQNEGILGKELEALLKAPQTALDAEGP